MPNSNASCPAKRWRVSRYATRIPTARAVIGAAMAESVTVVQNELHAAPAHRMPFAVHSMPNALDVMTQRERVIASPRLGEPTDQSHHVDDDGESEPRQRDPVAEPADRIGQRHR